MKEAFLNHTMNFIASNQGELNEQEKEVDFKIVVSIIKI